jgi:hypothetical protein
MVSLKCRLAGWRYVAEGRRDIRLDLLRGYAVLAMVVDHVAGISWITPFTGGNRFVVSAAEAFVFLAGLVMGSVFGRKIKQDGWQTAAEAILRRATVLYGVTVGLTLFFVALFQFTDLKLWLDRAYGLGLIDPVELVVGTLTLHYTYHGTDILWMYTILIAAAPFVLLLLNLGHTRAVLAGSWLLWLVYQFFPAQAAIPWVATNVNYFPVAAWQVIFVNGLVIGWYRDQVRQFLARVSPGMALAVCTLGMALLILIQRAHDTGRLAGWPIVGRLAGELYLTVFDKPSLAPGRLVAFVILFAFAYALVTIFWTPIRRALGWLLLPLGTSSLRAYSAHLLIIVLIYNIDVLARQYDRSRTGNTILQVVAVGLTLLVVIGWKRFEEGIDWRAMLPTLPTRPIPRRAFAGLAAAVAVLLMAGGAVLAGPVRGARQTSMAQAPAEAGVLRFVPPEADRAGPMPVLLALHGDGETGPEFARDLIDVARTNGWALIAPTVAYGDWSDPDQVAADAADLLPRLEDLVQGLDEHTGATFHPRVLVLGRGRGAHTARHFSLFYPAAVAAVATLGPAPCTLPIASYAEGSLPFPFGTYDVEQYVGEEPDRADLQRAAFWAGLARSGGDPIDDCAWGVLAGRPPGDRAEAFVSALRQTGATGEWVGPTMDGPDATLLEQAVTFLKAQEGKTLE